ncbi:MAG: urease subunit gamma [Ktedonobacteraceae bacterium]
MKLTPREQDRLTIFTLAEMARKRRARGIKLNYPEAVALLSDEVMEEARAGRSYDEVVAHGLSLLSEDDVLAGVAELAETLYIEPLFDDGTKLIVLRNPIRCITTSSGESPRIIPAASPETVVINANRPTITITITNTSAHPVQVTSHMPFWEINARMQFDREQARGYRLDIPAGGAVRWEPGETKEVRLCRLK